MNLVAPHALGPAEAYDLVAHQVALAGAELVGLAPDEVVRRVPAERRALLDLSLERTIEARLAARGR
jgi:hypothetical protein